MSNEKIYLSVVQDELGIMRVRDQHGRMVAGVQAVMLRHARDEAVTFTLDALDHAGGQRPYAPGRARKEKQCP